MDTEYAWAAGFIDGEGTITIKRYHRNGRIVFQPYISASQGDHGDHFNGIERLQELFGGSISHYKAVGNRQRIIAWSCVSRTSIECIKKIRPFLIVKAKNADILLGYYEGVGKRPKQYRLSEKELKEREKSWIKIRLLNQKGKLYLQRLNEETALKADVIV